LGETNMKLSRALLMVLLLHVVAVGGIVAFNAIKSRHDSPIPASNSAKVRYSVNATPAASPLPSVNGTTEKKSPPEKTKTYIVAKGDTLVTIAKKFRVPSDELLAVNHIDEPRKLKVGQKLTIPIKKPIAKKATD
jgi:LysM repeat protein